MGVLASLVAMLIYIWFRFEWQFGVGAVIATVHDVTMMIGLYVISGLEFNLTSIAAILTIVGYSINDTVVVYDRVRENLRRYKKMPIEELLDLSMNQTLSRTVLTGVTTLLALIALYLFGGEVIRSFTFAMIFGILVGTYSSIFVAGPLLILFRLRPESVAKDEEERRLRCRRPRSRRRPDARWPQGIDDPRGAFSRPRADRRLWQWRLPLRRHVASRLDPVPAVRHLWLGAGRSRRR